MTFPKPTEALGKNQNDAIDHYFYREFYKNNILTTTVGPFIGNTPGVADLWYDRHLYGKIDFFGNWISPRESRFKPIKSNQRKELFCLDFVAEAFTELKGHIRQAGAFNKTNVINSVYYAMNPVKAWEPTKAKYHELIKTLYGGFYQNYAEVKEIREGINDFNSFMGHFMNYLRDIITSQTSTPITYSGFLSSDYVSNNASGLIIEVSKDSHDDDKNKVDKFINDETFEFFFKAAQKFGFVIDKNAPWRLLANLGHPEMVRRMLERNVLFSPLSIPSKDILSPTNNFLGSNIEEIPGSDPFFDVYYHKSHLKDIDYLKVYFFQMYRSFIKTKPFYKKSTFCSTTKSSNSKLYYRKNLRHELNYTERDYWLKIYFILRMYETGATYDPAEVSYIIKNAKKLYNIKGRQHALQFLNLRIKKKSINDYVSLRASHATKSAKKKENSSLADYFPSSKSGY